MSQEFANERELEKEFEKVGLTAEQIDKLFTYLNMDANELINIECKNDVLAEGIKELETIAYGKKYLLKGYNQIYIMNDSHR